MDPCQTCVLYIFFSGGVNQFVSVYRRICKRMGVSKNSGTPKWMVYNGKPLLKWDDLGVPLFVETSICVYVHISYIVYV